MVEEGDKTYMSIDDMIESLVEVKRFLPTYEVDVTRYTPPAVMTCRLESCSKRYVNCNCKQRYCSPECAQEAQKQHKRTWWNKIGARQRQNRTKTEVK